MGSRGSPPRQRAPALNPAVVVAVAAVAPDALGREAAPEGTSRLPDVGRQLREDILQLPALVRPEDGWVELELQNLSPHVTAGVCSTVRHFAPYLEREAFTI
jgi:hypothetical protein